MDNLGNNNHGGSGPEKPIPLENAHGTSVTPKEGAAAGSGVSRAPLNLGATGASAPPAPAPASSPASPPTPKPAPAPAPHTAPSAPAPHAAPSAPAPHVATTVPAPQPMVKRPVVAAVAPVASGRITSCKTFFTKLHPGAIEFMDEQISTWLKENPSIVIKHTNVVTGEIQAKKTEPNIVITVWY